MLIRNGCLPFTPTQMYYHHRQLQRLWYPRQRLPRQPNPLLLLLLPNPLQTPPLQLPLLIKWTEVSWRGVYRCCVEYRELELWYSEWSGAIYVKIHIYMWNIVIWNVLHNCAIFFSHKATEGNAAASQSSATRLVVFVSLIVSLIFSFVSQHNVLF